MNTHLMASNFGTTVESILEIQKKADFKSVDNFKKGDIVVCVAGHPHPSMCICEVIKDNPDVDNFADYISGKSYQPLTSHLISTKWFKIN